MKAIINNVATLNGSYSKDQFAVAYRNQHPLGASLTDDNIRQAYAKYQQTARKIKQRAEGKRGPDRIRR